MHNSTFTNEDLDAVIRSWNIICGGTGETYLSMQHQPNFHFDDGVHWFCHTLFDHLLNNHPSVSNLFKFTDIRKHSYVFASSFGDILANINNSNEIHSTLMEIALQHSKRYATNDPMLYTYITLSSFCV